MVIVELVITHPSPSVEITEVVVVVGGGGYLAFTY
jgi:hypothetical protein